MKQVGWVLISCSVAQRLLNDVWLWRSRKAPRLCFRGVRAGRGKQGFSCLYALSVSHCGQRCFTVGCICSACFTFSAPRAVCLLRIACFFPRKSVLFSSSPFSLSTYAHPFGIPSSSLHFPSPCLCSLFVPRLHHICYLLPLFFFASAILHFLRCDYYYY